MIELFTELLRIAYSDDLSHFWEKVNNESGRERHFYLIKLGTKDQNL